MKLLTIILTVLFWVGPVAYAQKESDWEITKNKAASLINSKDCANAWQLIWPWARKGNIEARAILATAIYAAGLIPPNSTSDAITLFRHSLILSVHGSANGDPAALELLHALLREKLISDMGGSVLEGCLNIGTPPSKCVENAVIDGFVPSFYDYAREIDTLSRADWSLKASCRHGDGANGETLPLKE